MKNSQIQKDKFAANEEIMTLKEEIQKLQKHVYQLSIKKSIENEGTIISSKLIRRLMKEDHLFARGAKKRRYNSYLSENSADIPNKKILTDITEFHIKNDKVYLSPMIDCFDGYVLSWMIGLSHNTELANTMLKDTINQLDVDEKTIIH